MNLKQLQQKHNQRIKRRNKSSKSWGQIFIVPSLGSDNNKVNHYGISSSYKKRSPLNGEVK